ncbi:hypothetical protein L7F22_039546 [Adiantum nelumboides]|nr:hypothetical protein [Adiantum nelumboides]
MERWRLFFAQAEADLCTIIHQAILLAAADFPAEFKHRRCEIAEVLFARRPCPSRPTCSVDATMLSGLVITNATVNGEKNAPYDEACWEEDNDLRHFDASQGEVNVVGTLFHGTMFKPSAAERLSRRNDKIVELDTCLHSYNFPKDIPGVACDLAMDSIVLQNFNMIKDQIMESASQSEDGLLRSLHALEHIDITVDTLKATEIGREINKVPQTSIRASTKFGGTTCEDLKGMVDERVKTAEILQPLSASGEQDIANREVSAVIHQMISHELSDMSLSDRACCRAAVFEQGNCGLCKSGHVERKANSYGQQVQFRRCIATQSSYDGLGPGRPLNSTRETEKVFRNESLACEHFKKAEEKSRTYAQTL